MGKARSRKAARRVAAKKRGIIAQTAITSSKDRPLERSTIEAYLGIILGIIIAIAPEDEWEMKVFLLIIVLALLSDIIWRSSWTIKTSKRIKQIINLACGVLLMTIYFLFLGPPSQGSKIIISPSFETVGLGMDEETTLKVTNNHSYALYMVQVETKTYSGDLPPEDVIIVPEGETIKDVNTSDSNYKTEPPLSDKTVPDKSNAIIDNQPDKISIIRVDQKDKGAVSGIFFIPSIDPGVTKTFLVFIRKGRMHTISKIAFNLRGSYKSPVPSFTSPNQVATSIPPAGNFESYRGPSLLPLKAY
jgi:hypothetical protein